MTRNSTLPIKREIHIAYISTFISSLFISLAYKFISDILIRFYQFISFNDITYFISNGFFLFLILDLIKLYLTYCFCNSHLLISSSQKNLYINVFTTMLTTFLRFRRLFVLFCFIFYGGFFGATDKSPHEYNIFCFISFALFLFIFQYFNQRIKQLLLTHILSNFDTLYNKSRKRIIRSLKDIRVFKGLFNVPLIVASLTLLFVILNTQYEPLTLSSFLKDIISLKLPFKLFFFGVFMFALMLKNIFIEYQFTTLLLKEFSFSLCIKRDTENIEKEANNALISYLMEINKRGNVQNIIFVLKDLAGISDARVKELVRLDNKNNCGMKILLKEFVVFLKGIKRKEKLDEHYKIDNFIFVKAVIKGINKLFEVNEIKYSDADDVKRLKKFNKYFKNIETGKLHNINKV